MENATGGASLGSSSALPDTGYIYVTVTFFYCAVFLFGVAGNILVIYVICVLKDMRTPTNIFLLNLCFADLLVLMVCMPSSLVELHANEVWLLGDAMCKITPFLENSVSHTSILTILSISFERYYAICSPLEVLYSCSKTRSLVIISVVWVFGLISALPMMLFTHTLQTDHVLHGAVVVCTTPIYGALRTTYVIGTVVAFFLVPCVILIIIYTKICGQLLSNASAAIRSSQVVTSVSLTNNTRALQTRKQIIYMLITIIALFFICLLPFRAVTLWTIFSDNQAKENLGLDGYLNLLSFARVMLYLNSAGNPILYTIMSTKFREACKRALTCCHWEERRGSWGHGSARQWNPRLSQNGRHVNSSMHTEMEMVNVKDGKMIVTFTAKGSPKIVDDNDKTHIICDSDA